MFFQGLFKQLNSNTLAHGVKFWTCMRSKYEDLGEFETIWLHKTIRLSLGYVSNMALLLNSFRNVEIFYLILFLDANLIL